MKSRKLIPRIQDEFAYYHIAGGMNMILKQSKVTNECWAAMILKTTDKFEPIGQVSVIGRLSLTFGQARKIAPHLF